MRLRTVCPIIALASSVLACTLGSAADLYVATNGRDAWSGRLPEPNAQGTDGPLATISRAQKAARALRQQRGKEQRPVVVSIRGGTYYLTRPLTFTPEDSGAQAAPTVYQAHAGERPVVSGGVRLTGWRERNGRWELSIPEAGRGKWAFSQLFVNGSRRFRPRLPKDGYYFIAGAIPPTAKAKKKGQDRFRFRRGQLRGDWSSIDDVEVLCFHCWSMSRLHIADVDASANIVTFTGPTWHPGIGSLSRGGRYIVENVAEALDRPGEWYLDRAVGLLTYIPLPGENMASSVVVAPRLEELLVLKGDVPRHVWVEHIGFEGITFAHTNWMAPAQGYTYPQAEANLGAAISAEGARHCGFRACTVKQVATYAIEWCAGCQHNYVDDCELVDLGAGGVKIGGTRGPFFKFAFDPKDEQAIASHNTVRNTLIAHAGRMHPAAVGVWVGYSPHNIIEHNDIHDLYYTGISVGWNWGYGEHLAHHNIIADNHIHHCGQERLDDLGGIYTLGVSPGTVLRGNLIHDVNGPRWGVGIYLDQASSDILVENNVVYNNRAHAFHLNFGRENRAVNNVFALGTLGTVSRGGLEKHQSYAFERNVVYWAEGPLLGGRGIGEGYAFDSNLYWHAKREPVRFGSMTLEQWQAKGQGRNSMIADPLFVNPDAGDFRLRPDSPALKLGFKPIDMSKVGRRTASRSAALDVPHAYPRPHPPQPCPIEDGFELSPVGERATAAETLEETATAVIRVTDEAACSGKRSLKFQDGPGQKNIWNPHLYYAPNFVDGVIECSFDLRVEPGAVFDHSWRDKLPPNYHTGPALRVETDGTLRARGKALCKVPHSQWMRFEIVCGLGKQANGTYDLSVRLPGSEQPQRFERLPCDPKFSAVRWLGFVADSHQAVVFYLDNLRVRPLRKP